jgi:predicted anti-sigma-YlaC factor YlaD
MDNWVAANVTIGVGGLMIVGKIGAGVLSDYIGRANMCTICTAMTGVVFFALWLPATSEGMIWAFACSFGLFGGGFMGKEIVAEERRGHSLKERCILLCSDGANRPCPMCRHKGCGIK